MAKGADPRIQTLRLSLKESLAKQGIKLDVGKINAVITDVLDVNSLWDCGGGGCKTSCNTGCSDGCKDVSKTA